jgi:hypothetical protein
MGLKVGEFYQKKECAHASNNVLLPQILHDFFLELVSQGSGFDKKKFVQFVVVLYFLDHERPMTYFESMKYLFDFLKFKHFPMKYWSMILVGLYN